jgi:adenylosuccinate synthase
VITKLDVFSGFDTIRVCTRYRGDDEATFDTYPYHQSVLHHAVGDYVELPGWSEDITEARSLADLPQAAREYLDFIADFIGVPIVLVGVGPGREQIIWTQSGDRLEAAAA